MTLTFAVLKSEVRARLTKATDSQLITETRAGYWVNRAQNMIVRKNPGLRDAAVLDKTSIALATDDYSYDLSDLSYTVAYIHRIKLIDTSGSNYWVLEPCVGGLDEWDSKYPYIPDTASSDPEVYCRRAGAIEVYPAPSSTYDSTPLWVEYTRMPTAMTGDSHTMLLTDFDEEVIAMAMSYGFRTMRQFDEATQMLSIATEMIEERLETERDWDDIDMIVDHGPMAV